MLSSAVLNGGLCEASSFLNLRVDKQTPPPWLPPEETLRLKARELRLPGSVTAMMTAASMKSLGYGVASAPDVQVECWVTCGLSNVRRVGDEADDRFVPGTINIWLFINKPMSDTAMAEALIMLTESKVTAIRDENIISPVSGLPASGTGTDSHAVICPRGKPDVVYCGKHTLLGELIGSAAMKACQISLRKCLSQKTP
ncbi:adenosylcobinamide amidohydrolase [Vibrio salinus]|uniref:adenosylcobinamide amidohydrolase n=1 Tax=Vibrio salinus TaxID=2899784 RepID=UPI001E42B509|nr:adenosylcobinamide amidohydrolase [Vibrio salinus]MCE0495619.1 adenosylcobinamide amidohydrolase [Vibrio salinus]